MKSIIHIGAIVLVLSTLLLSCQKETNYTYDIGNPTINVLTNYDQAYFGDSLTFSVQVADSEIALSTLKAQVYYTDDMVAETVIRTKENGTYTGKISIPYYQNVPNGTATVKFVLQNISKKTVTKEVPLPLSRPDYPFLNLVTAQGTYQMAKVSRNQYAVTQNFPFSVKGHIVAPKFGANGNELTFGWVNNTIAMGSTNEIPFSNSTSGQYTIEFNTLTYAAAPFIIAYAIDGTVFSRLSDDLYRAELNLTQGQSFTIDGIEDIDSWWIDSDYFTKGADIYSFKAMTGKYRVTADFAKKYFRVEAMNGNNLAMLNGDGTGALWLIGEGVGKPNVSSSQVGWNTDNALCLAPMGNKRYQITLIGRQTANINSINFKFFHQKGWGGEFGHNSISTSSDIIFVGNGTNGRDSGNLGLLAGKVLEEDRAYILTVDLSAGNNNAVITFSPQ